MVRANLKARLLTVLLGCVLAFGLTPIIAQPAQAGLGKILGCALMPDPLLRGLCNSPAGGAIASKAADAAAAPIKAASNVFINAFTASVAASCSWLIGQMGTLMDKLTTPDLSAKWFLPWYNHMLGLAMGLMGLSLLWVILSAAIRQRIGEMMRAAPLYTLMGALICFVAPTLTQILLALADEMTAAFTQDTGDQATQFMASFAHTLANVAVHTTAFGGAVFLVALICIGIVLGGVVILLELIMRDGAVYLSVLMLPLAFSAMVSERSGWQACKKLIYFLLFIIFIKPFIALFLSIGMAMMTAAGDGGGVTDLLIGLSVILLAAFSPKKLIDLIPAMESNVKAQFAGPSRGSGQFMRGSAATGTNLIRKTLNRQGASSAAAGAGAGAATAGVATVAMAAASTTKKGVSAFGRNSYELMQRAQGPQSNSTPPAQRQHTGASPPRSPQAAPSGPPPNRTPTHPPTAASRPPVPPRREPGK